MTSRETKNAVAFHEFERAGWQRAAVHYPDTFGTLTRQAIEPLLDAASVGPGMHVLDVASGPGYGAAAARTRGARVIGIDFSPLMIDQARRRYPGLDFREGDAESLPFEDSCFDAVVMNFGLLHLARPEAAVAEAYRVLRRPGRYAVTVWTKPEEAIGFGAVLRAMETYGTADVGLPEGPPFFRFSEFEECQQTFGRAGFSNVLVQKRPLVWRLPSPDALFQAALQGGVRTSAALQGQTPQALSAIRRAVHAALQPYVDPEGLAVPMPAVLASATKS